MPKEVATELETFAYAGHEKKPSVQSVIRRLSTESITPTTPRPDKASISNDEEDVGSHQPTPTTSREEEEVQKWNGSKLNISRTMCTFWSFLMMGMNDAAIGALIPYLETYYNQTYTTISLTFLAPCFGSIVSGLTNNSIHLRFGQRGVAIGAPLTKLIAFIVIAVHPPYPVVVIAYLLLGFAGGLEDSAWNAWMAGMADTNEILGFLHGFYGLGGVLGPLVATSMVTKAGLPWFAFYYVMLGGAVLEFTACSLSFWTANGAVFRKEHPITTNKTDNRLKEALFTLPSARVTWLTSWVIFLYVGAEVALGGWIVTFMLRVRHSSPFASGMTATGFWLGITVGRVLLGFVTGRLGEKLAISAYLLLSLTLTLLFYLIPSFYVSAVSVSLVGFFLGPIFPAAVVVATKLLPKHLHIAAIGFAASIGGCGGAVFPFAVGAIAQKRGVKVLLPVVLALLGGILGGWVALTGVGAWGRWRLTGWSGWGRGKRGEMGR